MNEGLLEQIDADIDVITPENIAFHYQVAGPMRRFPAFLIDLAIRVAVFCAFSFLAMISLGTTLSPGLAFAAILVFWFAWDWFYGGFFETLMNGQTPGKWITGIRVLTTDGQPINAMQAVVRNVLRYADLFPLVSIEAFGSPQPGYVIPTFLLGLVVMSMNSRYQRLGDLVCGTMVIVEDRQWLTGLAKLDDPRAIQLAGLLPSDVIVSRSMAKALADYVDRRRFFSAPRRREVARHLGELLVDRFKLPKDTSHDLLLCALYYRTFIADERDDERNLEEAGVNPFAVRQQNQLIQAAKNPQP